jgi:transposase
MPVRLPGCEMGAGFGAALRAGVEGTNSYGAGLTRALQDAGIEVAEINRSDRAGRRRQGKSDPLDAYAAARSALAGHGLAAPKDEHTAALRALLTARRGAVKARTAAINQIKSLLITRPAELRERYRRHTTTTLIRVLARCRPSAHEDPRTVAVLSGLKAMAQRLEFLENQDRNVTAGLDQLVTTINPGLPAAYGIGPDAG